MPRYDADGAFAGYIGSCVDVTELLRQERALHQFEERVALAAEAAHLGVWEFDANTEKMWVSDKVREIFNSRKTVRSATVSSRNGCIRMIERAAIR